MDILVNVVLPLSLAIIMLSLGIGLTRADFTRVARQGWGFAIGALSQVVMVPLAAYLIVLAFGLSGELAVGVMLLAFCPGGVTSNMIAKFARGDVALSVSLTAVVSLLSILTVPFLAAWSVVHFLGSEAPDVTVAGLAVAVFLITTLPVAIGMAIRGAAPGFADRVERGLSTLAGILFAIIVVAALASNWGLFLENFASLAPALIVLNVALMAFGLGIAAFVGLGWGDRKTISVEVGIQNATLAIALGTIISGQGDGFSAMELPAAVYGITMYLVAIPFVLYFRSMNA